MKIRTIGRGIALVSVAAVRVRRVLELAVGAATARRRPPHRPPPPARRRPAAGDLDRLPAEGHRQPVLRRRQGRHRQGGRRDGATVTQVGPNEPKADLQVPFITDLTTQKVNAIIISADGKDEVAPALKAAMDAGIKVVGFDSSPAVGAYNVFVNQVDFSGVGVNLADWACELAPNCTGEIAILSAAATATNQNEWIELMKKTLDRRQVQGPQARRHRLRRRRRRRTARRRRRACSPSTRTSRSSSPRPPSASWRPPRSCRRPPSRTRSR